MDCSIREYLLGRLPREIVEIIDKEVQRANEKEFIMKIFWLVDQNLNNMEI
nr:hypothetical protein K-LCC10_0211 [Kaumoebavirus]